MENKFSQGNLVVDCDFITVMIDGVDTVICDFDPIDVCPTVYQRSREETEANKKLIAAAPELLSALESFVYDIENTQGNNNTFEESYHLAKNAIKKATE